MDRIPNVRVREVCGVTKGGGMKGFSGGSTMLKEWRIIITEYMGRGSVGRM